MYYHTHMNTITKVLEASRFGCHLKHIPTHMYFHTHTDAINTHSVGDIAL
jgi:hypothetical protein